MSGQLAGIANFARDRAVMAGERDNAEMFAEIRADLRGVRIEEMNAEYADTIAMPIDARVNRWLNEAPGAESEDVVELMRAIQASFTAARERIAARQRPVDELTSIMRAVTKRRDWEKSARLAKAERRAEAAAAKAAKAEERVES